MYFLGRKANHILTYMYIQCMQLHLNQMTPRAILLKLYLYVNSRSATTSTHLYVFQAIQQVPGELAGVLGKGRGGKVDGLGQGP